MKSLMHKNQNIPLLCAMITEGGDFTSTLSFSCPFNIIPFLLAPFVDKSRVLIVSEIVKSSFIMAAPRGKLMSLNAALFSFINISSPLFLLDNTKLTFTVGTTNELPELEPPISLDPPEDPPELEPFIVVDPPEVEPPGLEPPMVVDPPEVEPPELELPMVVDPPEVEPPELEPPIVVDPPEVDPSEFEPPIVVDPPELEPLIPPFVVDPPEVEPPIVVDPLEVDPEVPPDA